MKDKPQILIVDDDTDALNMLSVLLGRNGYKTIEVSDGSDALDIIKKKHKTIDTIILDLMLPGEVDGYAICNWLNTGSTDIKEIPIIVLSAMSSPSQMAKSFDRGAFQHIPKPYDVHYMLAVVSSMVRVKRIQQKARHTAEKFAAVFDSSPFGALVVDTELCINRMSRSLRMRFPEASPFVGLSLDRVFGEEVASHFAEGSNFFTALKSGQSYRQTIAARDAEGNNIWWDISASPLFNEVGDEDAVVIMVDDVTKEKEMEIQLREEIERTRKAEERTRKTLMRQDEIAFRLMKTKKELLDKQELLEDAYSKLEEANSKLELLSITDQLTGLFNRRHFDDVFAQEIQRAARYAHPFSVMMMDIDHFKNVNDTYGHQAGDFILKGVANILCSQLRETDILARYGGEEFVVVLPETGESVALSIAERIRGALEEHKFCCGDNELHVTISIGVVTASGEQDDEEVLHAADDALYKAKEEGRNRVVKAEQL